MDAGEPFQVSLFPRRADLTLLQHVSGHRQLSQAARMAGLTESAAARRIAVLSRRLGSPLVVRERGQSRVTSGGWLLYRSGRQLVDVLDYALEVARAEPGPVSRLAPMLRLAAASWDEASLVDLLAAWLPGIVVDLTASGAGGEAAAFEQYRVDAACCWGVAGRPLQLRRAAQVLLVVSEPLWVALPAGHRCAGWSSVPLADLAGETWVVAPGALPPGLVRYLAGASRAAGTLAAASATNQRSLVAQGQGVAAMSPLAAPRSDRAGFVLRPLEAAVSRQLYLAVDPATVPPEVAERLRRCLRANYAELAGQANQEYADAHEFPVPAAELADGPHQAWSVPALMLHRIGSPDPDPSAPQQRTLLEPEHLQLLGVIERAGSVNRAASRMLVTQPALTRRLRRLERSVGLTLLHTSPRGSQLSGVAQQLLVETAGARDAFESVIEALRLGRRPLGRPGEGWDAERATLPIAT